MTQRPPRPLRFLQSSLSADLCRSSAASPALSVYKPIGLPYFSTQQVAACANGSGARELFSARGPPAVALSDTSDSLLSRLTDAMPPGAVPRLSLPLIHPALTRRASAADVNMLTAQRRGTTLVAASSHELMFLRNCHRLGLVRSVYRVMCRVPHCVAARARVARDRDTTTTTTAAAKNNTFKNPYIRQFMERAQSRGEENGILLDFPDGLPRCAGSHPLLRGGFYAGGSLLRTGSVSGFTAAWQMAPEAAEAVERQRRLNGLFISPKGSTVGKEKNEANCPICCAETQKDAEDVSHLWISPECRLRIAVDEHSIGANKKVIYDIAASTRQRGMMSKPFCFEFRLLSLSNTCELALYEITTNDASDEEIKTVFAASNLPILNDFIGDPTLASAMLRVSQHLLALSPLRFSSLPMAAQNRLRDASPVELVAEPLQQNSTDYRGGLLASALEDMDDVTLRDRVAQLVLGPGIECNALHFPDPALQGNRDAVQHLLLRLEDRGLNPAQRDDVVERMTFIRRGVSVDCAAYNALLEGYVTPLPLLLEYFTEAQNKRISDGCSFPIALRAEEETAVELSCAYCEKTGHVWRDCPMGPPLTRRSETEEQVNNNNKNNNNNNNNKDKGKDKPTEAMHEEAFLCSVDDAADAIAASSRHNTQNTSTELMKIPNAAPTKAFNPEAWRRNNQRPALHQRHVRCAYCGSRHHITQCPKLSGDPSAAEDIDKEKLRSKAEELFCIKCGARGHLFGDCPTVPEGLSTALYCPICHVPHRRILHEPTKCPRRVSPPSGYLPSGVPAAFVRTRPAVGSRKGRHSVLLSDSFLSRNS